MRRWPTAALLAAIAFVAALAGTYAGRVLMVGHGADRDGAFHRMLHQDLHLDAAQHAALERLETHFAVRRRGLELEMRADNARLAEAIEAEHGIGPRVTEAIDRSHRAMGALQKETVAHVFAMRRLLRPDQAERFDRGVVKALTQDAQ